MRVAILIRKWATTGGNERVATHLARLLAGRGHEVRVLCQKQDESAHGVMAPSCVVSTGGLTFDPTLAMLSFAFSAKRHLAAWNRRGQVDVSIGFNHSVEQDLFRLGGGTQAEFIALHRAVGRHPPGGRGPNAAALYLERRRVEAMSRRHGRFIAPSLRVRDEMARHYGVEPGRVTVLHNGVDLERFRPAPDPLDRAEVRRRWGVGTEDHVALFVGQDLDRKGFWPAVEAAGRVGARLVYVGPAKRPARLETWVVWDGERKDVERCYQAADVLVLPSHYDPFGGVVLEAYASGLPAVATRRVGATELAVGSALEALLVEDPGDVDGLVAALRRAIDGRRVWGRDALRIAEGSSLAAWGERMVALLEERARQRIEERAR